MSKGGPEKLGAVVNEYQEAEDRRRRRQEAVVMPTGDDAMPLQVDGTKEYRRNALGLLVFGVVATLGSLAVLGSTGDFYYVFFGVGVFSTFLGVIRFFSGGVNG